MSYTLLMYSRSLSCPFVTLAKKVLDDHQIPYQEVYIDRDHEARERVLTWTGFLSVPTLVATETGSRLPYEAPSHLPAGESPRGIDRGAMITEPNIEQLKAWLIKHQFATEDIWEPET